MEDDIKVPKAHLAVRLKGKETMKKICKLTFWGFAFLFNCITYGRNLSQQVTYVDFDLSVGSTLPNYKKLLTDKSKRVSNFMVMLSDIKQLYDQHNLSKQIIYDTPLIPKIFHQIWLGGELPAQYTSLQMSWIELHPAWKFILWVNDKKNKSKGTWVNSLEELEEKLLVDEYSGHILVCHIDNFKLHNEKFFNESKNYGQQSDIARYEILYHFGGIYIDTDFECLKTFDILNHAYNFFTAMMPLENYSVLANGIIGSIAQHPILKTCINNISNQWDLMRSTTLNKFEKILHTTGPILFQNAFYSYQIRTNDPKLIAFPPSYFFPLTMSLLKQVDYKITKEELKHWIKPETFAIHYWNSSWAHHQGWIKHAIKSTS